MVESFDPLYQQLQEARSANNWIAVASALNQVAMAHLRAGEPDQALSHLNEALQLSQDHVATPLTADIEALRGETYIAKGMLRHARASFERAVELAHDINSAPLTLSALVGLGRVLAEQGELEAAS